MLALTLLQGGSMVWVLMAASALGGAVLTLAADIAVRSVVVGPELKLGVLTALIGAPFFLMLILKTRGGGR